MEKPASLVVYSDLDGTLLDHDTYSWVLAQPALDRLARLHVPVVLASSKTAGEIRHLQARMGLERYPAIVENGAGVLEAAHVQANNTHIYTQIRAALDSLPADLRAGFVGFGDMTEGEVARLTGLSATAARLACARQFSEPGLWTGSTEHRRAFLSELAKQHIFAREGGRFMTLSFGSTKKDRMDEINACFRPKKTIALGDAPNDVEMLEHADFGVIVANTHRAALPALHGEDSGRILRTQEPGPAGWNRAMNRFLDQFERHQGDASFG